MRTPLPKLLAHPGTLSTFLRKLPTLLGKRGGGLAFRNGARAADRLSTPEKTRPHPQRVPSGRRVHAYGASSAWKRSTPRERSFAKICFNSLLPFGS